MVCAPVEAHTHTHTHTHTHARVFIYLNINIYKTCSNNIKTTIMTKVPSLVHTIMLATVFNLFPFCFPNIIYLTSELEVNVDD